jgi:2-polyprenyl-6-methoxyphenol hydroxylase-like FAD-dependent oxidoreductase
MSEILDVVIVGGGLVGGLTALLLAKGGVQATVLDAAPVLDPEQVKNILNPRIGTESGNDSFIKNRRCLE